MDANDFLRSARVAIPELSRPGLSVGERIEAAIERTAERVGCNTNLGIVLLLAPLAKAATTPGCTDLRASLARVLGQLDVADSTACYRAIRVARPAGLGAVDEQDVAIAPSVGLREAMQLAAGHDSIAAQYVDDFDLVFSVGLPVLLEYRQRWRSLSWATTACYLSILAQQPDSHVSRKFGSARALGISEQVRSVANTLKACENPRLLVEALIALDRELKARGVNPGTSADLTVASLAVLFLKHRLNLI